jgi:hypothetical protein
MATPTNLPAAFVAGAILTADQMNNLRGAFRVLQVVYASYDSVTSNSTSTYADSGLTASITPQATTNKILAFMSMPIRKSAGNSQSEVNLRLVRGATTVISLSGQLYTNSLLELRGGASLSYLDSPATTSSTTYKVQFANGINAAEVSVQAYGSSTLTLMEISA